MSEQKMSTATIILIIIGVILVLSIGSCCVCASFGGTNSQSTYQPTYQPEPQIPTPEEVFDEYFDDYDWMDEDGIWEVLSSNAKSKTSKNAIYNLLYGYTLGMLDVDDYTITNSYVGTDYATLDVDVDCTTMGLKYTSHHTVNFVKEDGVWKIDEFVNLLSK